MRRIMTFVATAALALAPALAVAQSSQMSPIPDQEITKAGSALHDVAKVQQKYQPQMESASPAQKQGLSEQANAEALQAIQSRGLSVQEYSNVMRTAQTNPQVKEQLLQAARKAN